MVGLVLVVSLVLSPFVDRERPPPHHPYLNDRKRRRTRERETELTYHVHACAQYIQDFLPTPHVRACITPEPESSTEIPPPQVYMYIYIFKERERKRERGRHNNCEIGGKGTPIHKGLCAVSRLPPKTLATIGADV